VSLGEGATVRSNVELGSNTTLTMGEQSSISGDVTADDPSTVTIDCESGATINYKPCDDYTIT
jgi:spore coat protein U-like protein